MRKGPARSRGGFFYIGTSAGSGASTDAQAGLGSSPGSLDSSGILSNGSTAFLKAPGDNPGVTLDLQRMAGCEACWPEYRTTLPTQGRRVVVHV